MSRDFWCAISSFPSAVPGQVHTEQSFKTFIYMQHHYTLYHTNNYTDKDKTTSTHQLLNTSSTRLQSLTIENRNCGQINVNSTLSKFEAAGSILLMFDGWKWKKQIVQRQFAAMGFLSLSLKHVESFCSFAFYLFRGEIKKKRKALQLWGSSSVN